MKISRILTLLTVACLPMAAMADINPTATYLKEGEETTDWQDIEGDAPLHVSFTANPSFLEDGASLEWHFQHVGANGTSDITRYEENTTFDFTESGRTVVTLIVRLNDEETDAKSISVTIYDSHLEMPNAFSPNGDGVNDYYGAKGISINGGSSSGKYKSIVEFHAYIFNRWGQKLYEWTDIEGYWDGTYNGSPVKDGVYFVLVKARGADGIDYNIRRDVNLIRQFNTVTNESEGEP